MSIETENKLIAEFMGGKLISHPELNGIKMWIQCPQIEGRLNLPTLFQYHTSWDWLKPVIDKIIKTIGVKCIDECSDTEWKIITNISRMYIGVDILQAHHYVMKYIYWYNKNKL